MAGTAWTPVASGAWAGSAGSWPRWAPTRRSVQRSPDGWCVRLSIRNRDPSAAVSRPPAAHGARPGSARPPCCQLPQERVRRDRPAPHPPVAGAAAHRGQAEVQVAGDAAGVTGVAHVPQRGRRTGPPSPARSPGVEPAQVAAVVAARRRGPGSRRTGRPRSAPRSVGGVPPVGPGHLEDRAVGRRDDRGPPQAREDVGRRVVVVGRGRSRRGRPTGKVGGRGGRRVRGGAAGSTRLHRQQPPDDSRPQKPSGTAAGLHADGELGRPGRRGARPRRRPARASRPGRAARRRARRRSPRGRAGSAKAPEHQQRAPAGGRP